MNLFNIDFEKTPSMKGVRVAHIYSDSLEGANGDCIYIPAFHFYQLVAEAGDYPLRGSIKPATITIAFKYKAHSKMLEGFYNAIESGVLN